MKQNVKFLSFISMLVLISLACSLANGTAIETPVNVLPEEEEIPKENLDDEKLEDSQDEVELPEEPQEEPMVGEEPPDESLEDPDREPDSPEVKVETRRVDEDALLPFVTWQGTGGGGPGLSYLCGGIPNIPEICVYSEDMNDLEPSLGEMIRIVGVYFTVNENTQIHIERPDGVIMSVDVNTYDLMEGLAEADKLDLAGNKITEKGAWEIYLQTLPGFPIGEYVITATGSVGKIQKTFPLSHPAKPKLSLNGCIVDTYGVPITRMDTWSLVMSGFQPGEEVLLGVYDEIPDLERTELVASWYEVMDESGSALTAISPVEGRWPRVVAIGAETPINEVVINENGEAVEFPVSAVYADDCRPLFVNVILRLSVPVNTPEGNVYVAGTFQPIFDLSEWDPGATVLTRIGDFEWSFSFNALEGFPIEYKYTMGSWDLVEKGADCEEIANREITPDYGSYGQVVIYDTVLNWLNTGPCEPKGF